MVTGQILRGVVTLYRILILCVMVLCVPSASWAVTSLTQANITFNFDGDHTGGYYLDGSPWVVENSTDAGVVVTSITPNYADPGRHGWEENSTVQNDVQGGTGGCTASPSKYCDLNSWDSRLTVRRC